MTTFDPEKILVANPQLDPQRIAELVAYRARMEQAGYKVRTTYRVEPALGALTFVSQQDE